MPIQARPLTRAEFAPFGDVIGLELDGGSSANQGTATRYDRIAQLTSSRPGAQPNLAVFRSVSKALPFEVRLLERHPCSTQMFAPLACRRYLVVVCPDDARGEPDLPRLRAFVCGPGQGINYRANVWHHPIIALDGPADFLMLAWEDGSALDCEERPLATPLFVTSD
ncbi:ureidoglycolate lyase [Vitiosangium sp. GDMCC 1.1324]|uniref:ureidoglycolate lyase n=1 Tax=Vitiosangium sp. (strain GDMCC 1.1324) TaxID=2138576 RepID=UPI000D381454|nr:ureidoglycolate lyase [Vitiosangium sp. GDMCC 1.1324]PTL76874.1 ureidoglycolate hydrolase [Vitiosangium sp. GDMCC 1.1324]